MADDFSSFPEVGKPGASSGGGEFDQFPAVGKQSGPAASLGEMGGAALEAGGRSAMESSGMAAGAILGVKAGTAVAPFLGPLAPAGPVVGGIAGAVLGTQAGTMGAESVGLRSPEQMPQNVRPGAYAGQVIGGSAALAPLPFVAAGTGFKFGESMVGRFLNQIITTAVKRPVATVAAEASGAISAAGGAFVSETAAPGRADIRANAEFFAGALNPTRLAITGAGAVRDRARTVVSGFSDAGRQTEAAKKLTELLAVTGEDPVALARILVQQGVVNSKQTAAQKTGSVALGALESYLSKQNAQFGAEAKEMADASLDAMRGQIALLSATGDPAAFTAVQEARALYFRTLIRSRLDGATNQALVASGRIAKDSPAARESLSLKARESLEQALDETRAAETDLWSKVDGTRQVGVTNLQQTYDEIVADTLPELRGKKLPAVVRNFIDRVTSPREAEFDYDPETLTVRSLDAAAPGTNAGEMRKLRSELLTLARAAARDPDQAGMERVYSQLAEATMDDIDVAFKGANDSTYDAARTFSRELNDTFTRSFAGKVLAEGKYGDRVAPEILLRKALATGREAGALQLAELEEATRFMNTRGLGNDTAVRNMLDAQERIFRLAAADSLDPTTGRASPERINKFVRDNQTLLRRFPEVQADLKAAAASEQGLRRMQNRARGVEDLLSRQSQFGKLLGGNGDSAGTLAVKAADRVFVSKDPEQEIIRLAGLAKGGGTGKGGRIVVQPQESTEGLTAALFQAALDRSTPARGVLDIDAARAFLFNPISAGKKAPIQVMQEQGLVDPQRVADIRKLFDAASSVQRARKPGTAIDVQQDIYDVTTATLARMVGSTAAGTAARTMGSATPSLIVHGAGARLAETAMTKLPTSSVNKVLTEAMMDPQKMALLLMKAKTPEQASFQARQLHAWFVQSGVAQAADAMERDYQQSAPPPQMFSIPR